MKLDIVKALGNFIGKNSTTILTAMSIAGLGASVVMAAKASPEAKCRVDAERNKREDKKLKSIEIIKHGYKPFIPAAIMVTATASCIIGANAVNSKRNAALAGAYMLTSEALKDYKNKVIETFGDRKAQKVEDDIASDKVQTIKVVEPDIIITGKGNTLCCDLTSGRYFKSDMESLRRIENDLNSDLLDSTWVSLNDAYYMMGLTCISIGDDLGWDWSELGRSKISFHFSSQLAENGEPCLTVRFDVKPRYL